jgi:hypothetical protein
MATWGRHPARFVFHSRLSSDKNRAAGAEQNMTNCRNSDYDGAAGSLNRFTAWPATPMATPQTLPWRPRTTSTPEPIRQDPGIELLTRVRDCLQRL